MPGIVGIINKLPREKNEKDLNLMIDCMMHEPFYNSGTYINDKLGIYAGWVCHKGSFSDCMPILNEKRDLVLLFSGENFTDKGLINKLKKRGHKFDSFNASYLIHLYEDEGDCFLQDLNGWFSGIILDLNKAKLVLFNDRYGVQRIYYHENKDTFLFSSEAKSLLKIQPELRKIDLKSLGEFFICDCALQNRTLFSNVFLLPAGSVWTFHNNSKVRKDYYFNPSDWENQPILEKEIFYNKLKETFLNILPRYFSAKAPIGLALTSGLDTRMIISCLNIQPDELPCYTYSGMYRDTFDALIAHKVAEVCLQPHQTLRLNGDFISNFPDFAEKTVYVTDGCRDICGAHDIFFNKLAREIAPIRMSGKFGSEVIRDRTMFKNVITHCKKLFHPDFKKFAQEAVRTFTNTKKGHKLSRTVFKEIPWHEYGQLASEMSILTYRTPFMDNDLIKLMYQAPEKLRSTNELPLHIIENNNHKLRKIITDLGTGGKSNYFFSKCLQLFYYSLYKSEYLYIWDLPHWLAKLDFIFSPLHPERLIAGRYKFEHYRIWFRNEVSDYLQDILLDRRTANRPYINKDFLRKMVLSHINGDRNYFNEINKTLTAELIYRFFIDSI